MSTTPMKATLGTMFNQEIGRKSHESMAQEIKQSVGGVRRLHHSAA